MKLTRLSFIVLLLSSFMGLCACKDPDGKNPGGGDDDGYTVTVYPGRHLTTSQLLLSTTLTHRSFVHPENTEAIARAEGMLEECLDCLAQFTMDWGAGNTNPSKDTYNFNSLDRRVELFHRLGKKVVLTLCRCPAWMRRDDPSKGSDAAPRKDMYEEFGHMAADFIRHYNRKGIPIFAVNVWSETRGYWNRDMGRWELEDYADLYNIVYDSIKKVDPGVLVGGPFMHVESSPKGKDMALYNGSMSSTDKAALRMFISKARKLDFFSIDRNLKENADQTPYHIDTILKYTKYNGVIHKEVKELLKGKFDEVPVWVVDNQCLKGHYPEDVEAAGLASMFRWHLISGAGFVDKWQPEDEGHESTDSEQIAPEGLYTHTDTNDGAQPLPTMYVFRDYRRHFPPGTAIVESTSSNEFVEALASSNMLMLINKQSTEKTVEIVVDGAPGRSRTVKLGRFEVKTFEY